MPSAPQMLAAANAAKSPYRHTICSSPTPAPLAFAIRTHTAPFVAARATVYRGVAPHAAEPVSWRRFLEPMASETVY
jgi:hypothetical protein